MTTLAEVKELEKSVEMAICLFGEEAEFKKDYCHKMHQLGIIICAERGITQEEGRSLGVDTVLGSEAEKEFIELKKWLEESHVPAE